MVEACNDLMELVNWELDQMKGVKSMSKIFIGGIDQGCSVALATFLRYQGEKPFAGVIGINGF